MPRILSLAILLATFVLGGATHAVSQVGTAAAVRNDVRGSVAGALRSGSPVQQNETIAAAENSSAQLLFRDKTSLTVGPNSRVVIDRFVYNPDSGAGQAAVSVARGALRFVTGSQASSHYAVRTPSASVGVRGSIIEMFVSDLGYEIFVLIEGGFEVCVLRECRLLMTPGQYVMVMPNGSLSQPAGWTGPMLDLTASLNYILTQFVHQLESGSDPLPRYRDLNDALRTRDFSPWCEYYCYPD
ncbi:FecR family protein [Leptospira interrogans]